MPTEALILGVRGRSQKTKLQVLGSNPGTVEGLTRLNGFGGGVL